MRTWQYFKHVFEQPAYLVRTGLIQTVDCSTLIVQAAAKLLSPKVYTGRRILLSVADGRREGENELDHQDACMVLTQMLSWPAPR